ncbi:endonuclease I family protein [Ureibacillus sinduriensis]|uniref:Endonuclease I n=1 Tax=Ureibacillus sinduriensis BLB-1 = JCM 15800 TaxID=1384057 RepID=A0A0A3HT36_9BACL|nr:endonuclease [Ureibacillus sinduriensis]KGR74360.1 endonuclease I [Ureibacillus sinduriensis BLB-1 = JCM 15800]
MGKLDSLDFEWEMAKSDFLTYKENRPYFDEEKDKNAITQYYLDFRFTDGNLEDTLHTLLKKTHTNQLTYRPHRYLYPWVDLQENGTLKSLYSGNRMDPLTVIEEDIRLHDMQAKGLVSILSDDQFNCEHVVPQSWFDKKEPFRGDLHHLFACEPTCNSRRSNFPYYDFHDYSPEALIAVIKDGCGKAEEGKFEPEYGKGIIARATLYFLIRYPYTIKKELADTSLMVKWHQTFPVSIYEKHRNLAIHELQGNRNPFIDYPEMAEAIFTKER